MQNDPDERLMLKYQAGDKQAMEELIARYKNPVYRFAVRLLRNSTEAQDIAQEVFLKVHNARMTYKATGKFSTWIFSITHHACISRLRKNKWTISWPVFKNDPNVPMDVDSADPSPDEEASHKEMRTIVKDCIHDLPLLQKEILILREYENLDYEEIAKIIKKPLGTVKSLIHGARQLLKEKLLPYVDEGGYS
ncbi:MAG: sigma-70 family RNA polymerase sigma factor [Candidatus Omnitrophota bacterium]